MDEFEVIAVTGVGILCKFVGVATHDFEWVAVDVFGEIEELLLVTDKNRFVYALKKRANPFVLFVEIHGVFGREGAHKRCHGHFVGLANA